MHNPRGYPSKPIFRGAWAQGIEVFCEPMASQNAHLTQPKTMHCDVQALQREKFFSILQAPPLHSEKCV
jgi:hypothetical protein